jgi:hypothetical protein
LSEGIKRRSVAVGDPHFFAVQNITVAAFYCASKHAAGVGTELRLGETEASDGIALLERREPSVFLRVGAEGVNRIHDERGLHGNKAAQVGIAALKLLRDETVLDIGHARAAIALQAGALDREFSLAIVLLDDGENLVVNELACGLARELFLVREQGIEVEEIDSGGCGHRGLLVAAVPLDFLQPGEAFYSSGN